MVRISRLTLLYLATSADGPNFNAALPALKIDAAYILGLEDKIGSLEQGKFPGFTILEEDPFEVDPEHLKDISIWARCLAANHSKSKSSEDKRTYKVNL